MFWVPWLGRAEARAAAATLRVSESFMLAVTMIVRNWSDAED